jgi:putative oxidoreductase
MAASGSSSLQRLGIAFLRVVVGVVFLAHGWQKLFVLGFAIVAGKMQQLGMPLPMPSAVVVTLVEFLGGLGLILGLRSRWAAFFISIDMLVAVLAVHLRGGLFLPRGFEYALTLLAASVALSLLGPGALALDSLFSERKD